MTAGLSGLLPERTCLARSLVTTWNKYEQVMSVAIHNRLPFFRPR